MNCRVAVVAKADQVSALVVRLALVDMVNMQDGRGIWLVANLTLATSVAPAIFSVWAIFPAKVLQALFVSLRGTHRSSSSEFKLRSLAAIGGRYPMFLTKHC